MKTLFLLTKTYPFGNGEQYVSNELPYLAKAFDKVIIYPNDYYSSIINHNKDLPKNVEVLNFNQQLKSISSNQIADYFYLLKQTVLEGIKTDDKKYFIKNFKWNLINFWTQFQIAKSFSVYLKNNNYNSSNSVFYSYWFHKSAILLSILKDKNHISKFVTRAHSIDLYHHKWGIINDRVKVPSFKMFKLKYTDKIFTVSHHGETFLKNLYALSSHKVISNYLGVFDITNSENIRSSNKIVFHIVTCSGIDYNKRVHELAMALNVLKHQVKWTHFGDGDLKENLFKITDNFPGNIEFDFRGKTPNTDVKKYYEQHRPNLFVNLSIVEGLPVSIMEAMMYRIPILATAIYGTPEAVIENENGFLLDVNFTQQQLIDKLNYCMEHTELLMQYSKNSYNIYMQKFDAHKNYTDFTNYLKTF